MKISRNWLEDYLNINLSDNELSNLLTAIGLEVEAVEHFESLKGGLKGLVVGEVLTCEKHDNADKLSVCKVNTGNTNNVHIVCGAPNIAAGQKVAVAPINSTLYPKNAEPFTIKKVKIRGVESQGMICAEDEIGLGESHDGIMILPNDAKVGSPLNKLYPIFNDTVFTIGLTPNRSDAFSHIGVARDVAAALAIQKNQKVTLLWPSIDAFAPDNKAYDIPVEVKNTTACPRYTGVVITNLNIAPSPLWLQHYLSAIGVKTLNNVVDITNFINHELGQPLHAFDLRDIKGEKIVVKNLEEGTTFTTLDEIDRKLSREDLMICNAKEGMCIGGVFGGIQSGVKDDTTAIFLESAYFNPKSIRRTEIRHNLRTDAAARFEKGIDPNIQVYALKRAALLMKEIAGGKISSDIVDVYPNPFEPKKITLKYRNISRLTGVNISSKKVKEILELLDFEIADETDKILTLKAPLYRYDVTREADVIEEILRIYGYNKVPVTGKVNYSIKAQKFSSKKILRKQLAEQLSAQGFNEIITNSIARSATHKLLGEKVQKTIVRPLNSLNAELDILRPSPLLTGLEAIVFNQNRTIYNCKFYDFGKTYQLQKNTFVEKEFVALFMAGNQFEENWHETGKAINFYTLKGVVDNLLVKMKIANFVKEETTDEVFLYGLQYLLNQKTLVEFGEINSSILNGMDCKQNVFFANFNLDFLASLAAKQDTFFQILPKFPSIRRDLAIVVKKDINYSSLQQIIKRKGGNMLRKINLFDVYEDAKKLGIEKKSCAISLTFRHNDRTLQDDEIDTLVEKIIKELENKVAATIRKS